MCPGLTTLGRSGRDGTLLLYSQAYLHPGARVSAFDAYDVQTGDWLLTHGYALAGSGYGTGFALEKALHDQVAGLDLFQSQRWQSLHHYVDQAREKEEGTNS